MIWVWFWAVITAVQLALFPFVSTAGLVREYQAARRPAREGAAQRPRR